MKKTKIKTKEQSEIVRVEKAVEKELEKKRSLRDILKLALIFIVICVVTSVVTMLFLFGKLNINVIKHNLTSEVLPKLIFIPKLPTINNSAEVKQFDPNELVFKFNKGHSDFMLVDLRLEDEYKKEHIKYAISFPVEQGLDYDINKLVDKIVARKPNKNVIVYGHFSGSKITKEITEKLIEKNINAFSLSIGWNEWRHFRNLWLPESNWDNFDASSYLEIEGE